MTELSIPNNMQNNTQKDATIADSIAEDTDKQNGNNYEKKDNNVQKKRKKKFSSLFSVNSYLLLTILGVICIGLGGGISLFEISEYKMANYQAVPADSSLPQLKMKTTTLEAYDETGAPIKLDATDWCLERCEIQYDNTLDDKIIIEVTAPEDLYTVELIKQGPNYYMLHCMPEELRSFRFSLNLAKKGYILESYPLATMTLTMSETQAKQFQLNEEQFKTRQEEQTLQEKYDSELQDLQQQYEEKINDLEDANAQQMQNMEQEYDSHLEELQNSFENERQQYEQQLDEKEEEIFALQQQLEDVRNSLH